MRADNWTFETIGRVRSPLREKFGTPRQPGLVPALRSQVEILPPYDRDEAFRELTGYSHIWLLSLFHLNLRDQWQPMVRPPRLGGNQRVGVFASRAPYRPNPIGLSLCALQGIARDQGKLVLSVADCDLVNGTPILDIKPYLPYTDSVNEARASFAPEMPGHSLTVSWSATAREQLLTAISTYPDLQELIEGLLTLDPRPAYQRSTGEYGMHVYDSNVRFRVDGNRVTVLRLEPKR